MKLNSKNVFACGAAALLGSVERRTGLRAAPLLLFMYASYRPMLARRNILRRARDVGKVGR